MNVSIAICTWNRAASLARTLDALKALRIPDGVTWDVLVVDNNSSDSTANVVASYTKALPLRCVQEPKQGIAHARNRAIDEALGELIIFTDDDCLVDPEWLASYVEVAQCRPELSIFGGPIEPDFVTEPPDWVKRNLNHLCGPFAIIPDDPSIRLLHDGEHIFNANIAFRTSILRNIAYDPRFGRIGDGIISGEEIELLKRLRSIGYVGIWVGTARVRHCVPVDRVSPDYLWNWNRRNGRTLARLDGPSDCVTILGLPRWALRRLCSEWALFWLLKPVKSRRWVEAICAGGSAQGIIDEAKATRRPLRSAQ